MAAYRRRSFSESQPKKRCIFPAISAGYPSIPSSLIPYLRQSKDTTSQTIREVIVGHILRQAQHISYATMVLLTLVGYSSLGDSASAASSTYHDDALHMHVICLASADGDTVTCENSERLSAFDAWVGQTLYRPHSTFTVWAAGPNRQHFRPYFTACIPPTWGPGVMEAKARFIKWAREGINGYQLGPLSKSALPQSCAPPGLLTPGVHQLHVSDTASPTNPEVWRTITSRTVVEAPLHTAVICDRSDSTVGMACTTVGLMSAFDAWIADSFALKGASLSIYVVGSSRDTAKNRKSLC
jgi:hypothetical protein